MKAAYLLLLACVVLMGTVFLKTGDATYTLTAPPGPALMMWDSIRGPRGPVDRAELFGFAQDSPPFLPDSDLISRPGIIIAREKLYTQSTKSSIDVVLAQALDSGRPCRIGATEVS